MKKTLIYGIFLTAILAGCSTTPYVPIEYANASFSDSHTIYSVRATGDNSIGCEIAYGWGDLNYRERRSRLATITILDHVGNTIGEEVAVLPTIAKGKNGVDTVTAIGLSCYSIGSFMLRA